MGQEISKESWLQRARAEPATQPIANADTATATADRSQLGQAGQIWDPWEVWLRHVDRPRQRRVEFAG
jgi:hypothetical protein